VEPALGFPLQESGFKHILQSMVATVCYSYSMVDFNSYSIAIHDLVSQVFKLVDTLNIMVGRLKNLLVSWSSCYFQYLVFFH
jgi:hypothetical protein